MAPCKSCGGGVANRETLSPSAEVLTTGAVVQFPNGRVITYSTAEEAAGNAAAYGGTVLGEDPVAMKGVSSEEPKLTKKQQKELAAAEAAST